MKTVKIFGKAIPLFVLVLVLLTGTAFAGTILVTNFTASNNVSESLTLGTMSSASSGVVIDNVAKTITISAFPNEDKIVTIPVASASSVDNRGQVSHTAGANINLVTYVVSYSTDAGVTWTVASSANQVITGLGSGNFLVKIHVASDSTIGTFGLNFNVERTAV